MTSPLSSSSRPGSRPSDTHPGLRATLLFLGILALCPLLGWVMLGRAGESESPFTRGFLVVQGITYLALAAGLVRLYGWVRRPAALFFLCQAAFGFVTEPNGSWLIWVPALNLVCGWLLLAPSVALLFRRARGVGAEAIELTSVALVLCLLCALGLPLMAADVPPWSAMATLLGLGLMYMLLVDDRVRVTLSTLLAPRPEDIDRAAWPKFRRARTARLRGNLDAAEALLAERPDTRSVRILRGLIAMDRAHAGGSLRRVVFEAAFAPLPANRGEITESCRGADLHALVAERAELIDGLLEDAAAGRPAFGDEANTVLERLTGRPFAVDGDRFRQWWQSSRENATGEQAMGWLVARLWQAKCTQAAEIVASKSGDRLLSEAACLARILDDAPQEGRPKEWLETRWWNLCFIPGLSDSLGLLHVDYQFVEEYGAERVGARLQQRVELVDYVCRLWDTHERELATDGPWLVFHLTGCDQRRVRVRARFLTWWVENRPLQERFDEKLAQGMRAAQMSDWSAAEQHFGRAHEAWPERTCAMYNRALMLMECGRPEDALPLLEKLTAREPEEPLWRVRLGDCLMKMRRGGQAHAEYEKAAGTSGDGEALGMRLGLSLAQQGRDSEAEFAFDAVLGPDPDLDTLEEISSQLELEGAYRLAQLYRRRAFYKSLGIGPEDDDDPDFLALG